MPYDSGGNYTLPLGYRGVTGQTIITSQHNPPLEDIGAALSQVLLRSGVAPMTGNLNMSAFRVMGVAAAQNPGDAPRLDQVMAAPAMGDDGNLLSFDGAANVVKDSGVPAAQVLRKDVENLLGTTPVRYQSDDAGTEGPEQEWYHNSASPAASDVIHRSRFYGEDSGGNKTLYAELLAKLLDPTDTSEAAILTLRTVVAGLLADRFHFGAGMYAQGLTDQGAGTVNAAGVYADGVFVGPPSAVLEDQKSSGTDGGSSVSGAWRTRDLNTEVRDPSGLISISSNQFTPSADGWVEWEVPFQSSGSVQSRLYNVTDSVEVKTGTSGNTATENGKAFVSQGGASVTSGKAYRIEYRVSSSNATNGLGVSGNFGSTEVYTRVKFWRTA